MYFLVLKKEKLIKYGYCNMKFIKIRDWIEILSRYVLGIIFVYFGFDKIMNIDGFIENITNYQLLPTDFIEVFGIILPWFELLLGGFLILKFFPRIMAVIASILLFAFMIAIISLIIRGININCGCYAQRILNNIKEYTIFYYLSIIFRDLVLILLCYFIYKFNSFGTKRNE